METLKLTASEAEHLQGHLGMTIEDYYSKELESILGKLYALMEEN